jgi:hypothetical protein
MNRLPIAAMLMAAATITAQGPQPGKNPDQLRDLAKQSRSSGDLQAESDYLCQAAVLDNKKYGKKCEKAKTDTAKTLLQFQADLDMGRTEMKRKDYAGALRDLGKITFGPAKGEAHELIVQAQIESGSLPPGQLSQLIFVTASAAYTRGDFDRAESLLKRVQSPSLQAAANQLESNINAYRDNMKQADALAHDGDLKGAAQKYQSAGTIKYNGPGQPLDRLREVLNAQAKADQQKAEQMPPPSVPSQPAQAPAQVTTTPRKGKYEEKTRNSLTVAHRAEAGGDLKGALRAYEDTLRMDARQADALAGRNRVLNALNESEHTLESSLAQGITEFYASDFSGANNVINKYLLNGSGQHSGAAHFYLGASLLSQAILDDPKNSNSDTLRREAVEQFVLARQNHYIPVTSSVSPKILAEWTKASGRQ